MPFVLKESVGDKISLAVWKIEEEEDFFCDKIGDLLDSLELDKLRGRRRIEWMASRYLLQTLLSKEEQGAMIEKDNFGKPMLVPPSRHISISHTRGFVAAIIAPVAAGIDIQTPVEKISRIVHKFISSNECNDSRTKLSNGQMHVYWGAKEAMFKIYGRKQMDFKKHLVVSPFAGQEGQTLGRILKEDYQVEVSLRYSIREEFVLVYGWEIQVD